MFLYTVEALEKKCRNWSWLLTRILLFCSTSGDYIKLLIEKIDRSTRRAKYIKFY